MRDAASVLRSVLYKEILSPDRETIMIVKIKTRLTYLVVLFTLLFCSAFQLFFAPRAIAAEADIGYEKDTTSQSVPTQKSPPLSSPTAQAPEKKITKKGDEQRDFSSLQLCPGGMVFGVRMSMPGVMIVSIGEFPSKGVPCKPAAEGGLAPHDIITHVNGKEVHSSEDLSTMIQASSGEPLTFTVTRYGKAFTHTVRPTLSDIDGQYRLGIHVRDHMAGIGTVTFIDPQTGAFGGLGHGICDADTGALFPFERGYVSNVRLVGIVKGQAGTPGELRGTLDRCKTGKLLANSEAGVFGMFAALPTKDMQKPLPLAKKSEVKVGKAEIHCTLNDGNCRRFDIEITKIHSLDRSTKCFSVRVTDPELLSLTGGIVQGMSGSPIIQGGKLVGAVTHVMVSNPCEGYGIFIENMLNAAK